MADQHSADYMEAREAGIPGFGRNYYDEMLPTPTPIHPPEPPGGVRDMPDAAEMDALFLEVLLAEVQAAKQAFKDQPIGEHTERKDDE